MPVSLISHDSLIATNGTLTIDCTGAGVIVAKIVHNNPDTHLFAVPKIGDTAMTELLVDQGFRSSHGVWYKTAPAQGNVTVTFPVNTGSSEQEMVVEAYSGDTLSDEQYIRAVTDSQTLTCANFTADEDLVSGLTNSAYIANAGTGVTFHETGVSGKRFSAGTRQDGADYNVSWSTPYDIGMTIFRVSQSAPTATITDIDGDESVYPGQSYIIQATDDIGATAGTVFWERLDGTDSVQHTVTNWDAATDQITVTAVRGTHNYGAGLYRARVVLADTTEIVFDNAGAGLTLEAEPGTFAVTAASPNTTDSASLWTGLIDTATGDPVTVVDGDQAWVKDPNNLGTVEVPLSITPAGAISAGNEGDFVVQFWKASEGVWGVDQTVTFTASSGGLTDLELKKKQNKRRRYTANLFGAWRNRFMGGDDE